MSINISAKLNNFFLSNAIKFSDKGDEIIVGIKDRNEFVKISVKDYGIGIGENHLNMIFDRFKQVNESLSKTYKYIIKYGNMNIVSLFYNVLVLSR